MHYYLQNYDVLCYVATVRVIAHSFTDEWFSVSDYFPTHRRDQSIEIPQDRQEKVINVFVYHQLVT